MSFLTYCKQKVERFPYVIITLITALAAFGSYTSMYAFRKAFTAGMFEEAVFLGIDYKLWLISSQIMGYILSKFYGIKFIAELGLQHRGKKILALVGIAWLALLGFAVTPSPYNIVFMFINGLPLGMIWGLVFSFLEGRRTTEFLGAFMSITLVFASGFAKTVARMLIDIQGISEYWMPFYTGLIFAVPLAISCFLLEIVPAPNEKDVKMRTLRLPMDAAQRKDFLLKFLPGIVFTVFAYLLFTVLRDLRDNFQVEIWADLGVGRYEIYAKADSIIALTVLVMMSLLILVKNNFRAFALIHTIIIFGCVLAGGSTIMFQRDLIGGTEWMILSGLGLYMAYIPYNAIFFERLIASYKQVGNIGFIMYVADSIGYLGSVSVLFVREFGFVNLSWGAFYQQAILISTALAGVAVCLSLFYFTWKKISLKKTEQIVNPIGETFITYPS